MLQKVAVFYGSNSSYVEQPNMVWPNGVSPPVNTPVCGYSGIEGPCVPEGRYVRIWPFFLVIPLLERSSKDRDSFNASGGN